MIVIYKITSPFNKIYIGQTKNITKRKDAYKKLRCKYQHHIYRSLVKYGWENHLFEIQEILPNESTQDYINSREIYWWKYYKDLGYEMLNIKYPGSNGRLPEESLRKMGESRKGIPAWNKGIPSSLETRQKISKNRKGKLVNYHLSEEAKRKISIANTGKRYFGRVVSQETRDKISKSNKGRVMSLKSRNLIGLKNRGKKRSEEIKLKQKERSFRPIVMLDLEGNLIKKFNYVSDAAKFLNLSQSTMINLNLSGKTYSCIGFQFIEEANYDNSKDYRKGFSRNCKKVEQYDLDGNFMQTFMSTMDVERYLGKKYSNSNISRVCKDKTGKAYGFIWKYSNKI